MNLLQSDRDDRRPDDGQPRARLRARHDRLAAAGRKPSPTTPSTSPSCCPTSSGACSPRAPFRPGSCPCSAAAWRRAGMRTRRLLERNPRRVHAGAAAGHDHVRDRHAGRDRSWLRPVTRTPRQVRAWRSSSPAGPSPICCSSAWSPCLSGVLNSLTRFAVAAFAPALLNIALIVGLLVSPPDDIVEGSGDGDRRAGRRYRPVRFCAGSQCAAPASSFTSAARE